jgi:hypothetical protein
MYVVTEGSTTSIHLLINLDSCFSQADKLREFICIKRGFQGTATGYVSKLLLFTSR